MMSINTIATPGVDSSVWIDFFRGTVTREVDRLADLLGTRPLVMGDLILAEVLRGFPGDLEFHRARARLVEMPLLDLCDGAIALQAAYHLRVLRSRGVTVRSTIDALIATRCIADGMSLLYSGRDFDPFVEHLGLRSALAGE